MAPAKHAAHLGRSGPPRPPRPPSAITTTTAVAAVGWAVVAVVAAGAWAWTTRAGTPVELIDLEVYRWAGQRVLTEPGALYTGAWRGWLPFTYPPFAALVLAPFGALPSPVAAPLLLAGDAALLIAISRRCLHTPDVARGFGDRRAVAAAVALVGLLAEPVTQTLLLGQINLVVVALVCADLLGRRGHRFEGIGLGLAMGLKLTPAVFLVHAVATRRFRTAWRAVATFAATIGVAFAVRPADAHAFWIGRLFLDPGRVGGVAFVANQSMWGALVRAFGPSPTVRVAWLAACLAVLAVATVVARRFDRRNRPLAGLCVIALAGLLISPVSWTHHWVWVVPGAFVVAGIVARERARGPRDAPGRRRSRAGLAPTAGAGLLAFAVSAVPLWPGVIWQVPHAADRERSWTPPEAVVGNLYVLVGLGLLVAAWHRSRPARRATAAATAHPREIGR